VHHDARLYIV